MPRVVFFREANGEVPFVRWLEGLSQKGRDHVSVNIARLRTHGHLLRRPESDYLVDGIHELRFRCQRLNYRVLYFFHGRELVVLSHGIFKQEARVSKRDIEVARRRRLQFQADSRMHTHGED